MGKSLRALVLVAVSAALFSSCSCEEKKGRADAGVDAGTDSGVDAGADAGLLPVDPEVQWVEIQPGSFTFGAPLGTPCMGPAMEKEVPVTLTRPFLMSKYELKQKQWKALGFPLPHRAVDCDDCPITFLNTHEAMAWCNALSAFEGLEECYDLSSCTGDVGGGCPDGDFYRLGCLFVQESDPLETVDGMYLCSTPVRRYASMYDCAGYRLPTGPEWEYAAKAGTTTNTYNGDITEGHDGQCANEPILDDIAWYCDNTGAGSYGENWHPDQIRPVGQKLPNPWDLYDMLGNAGEWVDYVSTGFALDDNEGKPGEALIDPMGTTEDDDTRGDLRGSYMHSIPCIVRTSWQGAELRDARAAGYGFRPVRTLPATAPDAGVGDSGVK